MITSVHNEKIKTWCKLHLKKERDRTGLFLVEDDHMIEEAMKANCVDTLIVTEKSTINDENSVLVSEEVMKKLSQRLSSAKAIAVCRKVTIERKDSPRILCCDGIQDPGNLGTILRCALAFGFDEVYVENCVDEYNDKTLQASQGAIFHLFIERCDLLEKIKQLKKTYSVIATSLDGKPLSLSTGEDRVAIILGNEGSGVRKILLDEATSCVKIEMQGIDSLNVAVAGGICMYAYRYLK